ncbi:hypothetical protein T484DRAFT_1599478, partial [Baffinella frigidus]
PLPHNPQPVSRHPPRATPNPKPCPDPSPTSRNLEPETPLPHTSSFGPCRCPHVPTPHP